MKNPLIPYGLIAVLGILGVIIFSFLGVEQREAIQNPDTQNEEVQLTLEDAEKIYQNKCSSCHGADLAGSGDMMPALANIGSKLTKDEIKNIIIQGQGNMPPGLATPEEAEILGEWLESKK